jgi:hypothetical protein
VFAAAPAARAQMLPVSASASSTVRLAFITHLPGCRGAPQDAC